MILDKILQNKRQEVDELLSIAKLAQLEKQCRDLPPARDFKGAIQQRGRVNLIAEIKRRSPSKGVLCPQFDHLQLARIYQDNGAAAISVLTDTTFFGGEIKYLQEIHEEVALPLLRKDFIIDPVQIYQSRLAGADAVLLIAAALNDGELAELYNLTRSIGMQALVEVHTLAELNRVLTIGVEIIGINNRNLQTFDTDLATTSHLASLICAPDITIVSESGIHNARHMEFLRSIGVNAALVGEALVTARSTADKVRELALGGGALAV